MWKSETVLNKKIIYITEHNTEMTIIETKAIDETFIGLYLAWMRATRIQQKPKAR